MKCALILLGLLLLLQPLALRAQNETTSALQSSNATLRVLVREVEPFAFTKGGQRTGFALELWTAIAKEAGFQYDLQTVATPREMVDALADRKADVGVGALSIIAEREEKIDFSQPFYNSGLGIVTSSKGSSAFDMVKVLFNARLLKTLGFLLALVLVFSHVLWLFERKVNEEEFPDAYKAGVFESIWWTITVLITLGCENKSPKGVPGRLMAILWMASGLFMISLITASFTTSLTVSSLEGIIKGPADLAGHKVATVGATTAETWLSRTADISVRAYPSAAEAVAAVSAGEVMAAVYDEPILRYQLTKHPDKNLRLVSALFKKEDYGFGLQSGSPLRKTVNQTLLKLIEDKKVEELHKKWFGEITADQR
jgi:ABC-type amino acid transport substrate-binding protein